MEKELPAPSRRGAGSAPGTGERNAADIFDECGDRVECRGGTGDCNTGGGVCAGAGAATQGVSGVDRDRRCERLPVWRDKADYVCESVFDPWDGATAKVPAYVRHAAPNEFTVFAINCAHLGCPVRSFSESQLFMCPCHGGVYYAGRGPRLRGRRSGDCLFTS